jgi:hypothetical protein
MLISLGNAKAILSFHYDTLEMLLYRSSLSSEISDTDYATYPATRLDHLYRCLEATKSLRYPANSVKQSSHYRD